MSIAKLDLTQENTLKISIEEGIIYAPSIKGFKALDTGYTLTVGAITYTVGSGLALIDTAEVKSIVWALDGSAFSKGVHRGFLLSDSKIAGTYLKMKVELTVE